jgi:nitrate/TMAO reductase-like tetraheme cytochrome c subunit
MRRLLKILRIASLSILGVLLVASGGFAVKVLWREPLRSVPSTRHSSLDRTACIECHAPIADEWRQSYHFKSLTGPYWNDVRQLGYLDVFNRLRKQCVNCHAPANVVDLARAASAGDGWELGVECTPNLLREPSGIVPTARADQPELGVDCTSCHVGRHGVVGSGRHPTTEHTAVADVRFQDPAAASEALCGVCHRSAVEAWKVTRFAAAGTTCLDCHMPEVEASTVAGGPPTRRRSHRFAADKDEAMLARAVNATLAVTDDHRARLSIVNDRVGHHFPTGGNWVSVRLQALDDAGRVLAERMELFGREEALLLDVWPFAKDTRIRSGERKEVLFPLPEGHGLVRATVRYHDWMKTRRGIATFEARY